MIGGTVNAIAHSFNVVHNCWVCVAVLSWNGVWVFVHTLKHSGVTTTTFWALRHKVAVVLSGPASGTLVPCRDHELHWPIGHIAHSTCDIVLKGRRKRLSESLKLGSVDGRVPLNSRLILEILRIVRETYSWRLLLQHCNVFHLPGQHRRVVFPSRQGSWTCPTSCRPLQFPHDWVGHHPESWLWCRHVADLFPQHSLWNGNYSNHNRTNYSSNVCCACTGAPAAETKLLRMESQWPAPSRLTP